MKIDKGQFAMKVERSVHHDAPIVVEAVVNGRGGGAYLHRAEAIALRDLIDEALNTSPLEMEQF